MFTLFGFTVGFFMAMVIVFAATLFLKGLKKLFSKRGAPGMESFTTAIVVIAGVYMLVCAFWPTVLTFMLWRSAEISFGRNLSAPKFVWSPL